jgi:GT2 family glycosyltransferase
LAGPGRGKTALADVDVSVILVNYNTATLLREVVGTLRRAGRALSLQIIIVDNASSDGSVELLLRDFADCELIFNHVNVGFGRANNQALDRVVGRYVLLLNTDAFVAEDSLDRTVAYMDASPRCGILGAKLVGRDGSLQPSARYFMTPWNVFLQRTGMARYFPGARLVDDMSWDFTSVRRCDWVPGCFYLVRREVIAEVGLFDPRYFLYFEEVDHCRAALRAGWEVACFPGTTVVHIGGESAKRDATLSSGGRQIEALQIESELLYFRKNHGLATVVGNVILVTLADLIDAIKGLIRRRPADAGIGHVRHALAAWTALFRTALGARPTR